MTDNSYYMARSYSCVDERSGGRITHSGDRDGESTLESVAEIGNTTMEVVA